MILAQNFNSDKSSRIKSLKYLKYLICNIESRYSLTSILIVTPTVSPSFNIPLKPFNRFILINHKRCLQYLYTDHSNQTRTSSQFAWKLGRAILSSMYFRRRVNLGDLSISNIRFGSSDLFLVKPFSKHILVRTSTVIAAASAMDHFPIAKPVSGRRPCTKSRILAWSSAVMVDWGENAKSMNEGMNLVSK